MAKPASGPERPDEIVVGVDGSKHSADALVRAVQLGEALNCGVRAITTYVVPTIPGSSMVPVAIWNPQGDAAIALESTIARSFHAGVPELLTYSVVEGPAAKTLIGASKNATMLVVGSRGHGGIAGVLLGSVSTECAEHAQCPVLVIH